MKANSNNGLTPTMVLRFLNSQMGTYLQTLELTSKEMMRVVYQQSLQTYSQYFPFLPICTLENKDRVPGTSEYRIPNPWNLQILSLHKYLITAECLFGGGWIAPFTCNPVDSQILRDRMSMFMTPLTIDFFPPNRVMVRQNYYDQQGQLSLIFTAVHPNHLKTIQPNMRDDFLHLCLYDVLISLYPLRHRFQSINTPYGSLEPFFDLVDSAKDNRDNLLQKWSSNFLFASDTQKIWIV